MKHTALLFLIPAILLQVACVKDDNEATPELPIAICGIDGMRLEAHVDGSEACFSTSLIGNLADGQIMLGGSHPTTGTLAIQLDNLATGTHAASGNANHILLVLGGMAYESSDEVPGYITISSHDQGGNRIKGSFSAQLISPEGGPTKTASGTFDVTYIEQ